MITKKLSSGGYRAWTTDKFGQKDFCDILKSRKPINRMKWVVFDSDGHFLKAFRTLADAKRYCDVPP